MKNWSCFWSKLVVLTIPGFIAMRGGETPHFIESFAKIIQVKNRKTYMAQVHHEWQAYFQLKNGDFPLTGTCSSVFTVFTGLLIQGFGFDILFQYGIFDMMCCIWRYSLVFLGSVAQCSFPREKTALRQLSSNWATPTALFLCHDLVWGRKLLPFGPKKTAQWGWILDKDEKVNTKKDFVSIFFFSECLEMVGFFQGIQSCFWKLAPNSEIHIIWLYMICLWSTAQDAISWQMKV